MDSRFCVVFLAVASALVVANVNAQMGLMGGTYSHEMIQRCQGMIQQIPNSFTFPGMGGVGYGGLGMGGGFGVGVPNSGVGSPYYGVGVPNSGVGSPYSGVGSPYSGMGSPYYGMGVGGLRSSDGQEVNADPAATGEPGAPGAPAS